MVETNSCTITILYGSQTGTAYDFAEKIYRDAIRHHFSADLSTLDDFNANTLPGLDLAAFVVSTTGQGDPPDNMANFWKFIMRRNLSNTFLKSVKFAVIGLGDSSYSKFNFVAKKLYRRLQHLSGEPVSELVLGDEQHDLGPDAVLAPWLNKFWGIILKMYPLPVETKIIPETELLPPKFKVIETSQCKNGKTSEENECFDHSECNQKACFSHVGYSSDGFCHVPLISNERITADDHWQDVRLIKLDISSTSLTYKAGDVLIVQPQNSQDTVDRFLALLNLKPLDTFTLEPTSGNFKVPFCGSCTYKSLAEKYLDFNGLPKRYFWELLSIFTTCELEREKLKEFSSTSGQQDLFTYCHRPRRTVLEVLEDFPHATAHIPKDYLFDLIGSLQPRYFSIASSVKMYPTEVHLLVAVVQYKTILKAPRKGVCSIWLAGLEQGHCVPVKLKAGTIVFPSDVEAPVIMVGPGTGVAPFRSFIQERVYQKAEKNWLFFGCRKKDKDFLCKDEFCSYVGDGLLSLFTAFSRDQEDKVYVQQRLKENGQKIYQLLQEGALFYIAGNSKQMPDGVRDALQWILMTYGALSANQARAYIQEMENIKSYQSETWS